MDAGRCGQCPPGRRLAAAALAAALVASGCGSSPTSAILDRFDSGEAGGGLIAVGDSRAAFAARDMLALGGTAADAAVAAALVLAVVDPAAAALGGGGACLVHESATGETRALDFLPATPRLAVPGRPAVPVPGSVRGLFLLARGYGRLQWWELVEPAARLARFGTLVDGRLAADLVTAAETLRGDRSVRAVFFDRGAPRAVGQELSQLALAVTLARLARYGPGDFYAGVVAEGLARGAEAAGMSLARSELAAYQARWHEPARVPDLGVVLETVPLPVAAGGPTASLALADAEGLWVACSLGMGGTFGSGRMAESTGVLFAAVPPPGSSWLGGAVPALVREGDDGAVRAAAAGIGADGPGSLLAAVRDGTVPPPASALVACPRGAGGPGPGCEARTEGRGPDTGASALR